MIRRLIRAAAVGAIAALVIALPLADVALDRGDDDLLWALTAAVPAAALLGALIAWSRRNG